MLIKSFASAAVLALLLPASQAMAASHEKNGQSRCNEYFARCEAR